MLYELLLSPQVQTDKHSLNLLIFSLPKTENLLYCSRQPIRIKPSTVFGLLVRRDRLLLHRCGLIIIGTMPLVKLPMTRTGTF